MPAAGVIESVLVRLSPAQGFIVQGAWLGMSPAAFGERHPEDGAMRSESQWVSEGITGMVGYSPRDRSPLPTESAVFLDGELLGFGFTVAFEGASPAELAGAVGEALGAPSAKPPAWCAAAAFFADYELPEEGTQAWFWGDEPRRAVLMLSHDPDCIAATILLAQVDKFPGALDACVGPLIEQMDVPANAAAGR